MKDIIKKRSKMLSLVLRHQPEVIDLQLDAQGWADVDELLQRMAAKGHTLTRELLDQIVESNDKKRFSFDADGTKIRANQGHSISVDLELDPTAPPKKLYHGTATRFEASVREQGLLRMSRQYVHLSHEIETALQVGQRHGKPFILTIKAGAMAAAGYAFYRSENGVWLTEAVPLEFIEFPQAL